MSRFIVRDLNTLCGEGVPNSAMVMVVGVISVYINYIYIYIYICPVHIYMHTYIYVVVVATSNRGSSEISAQSQFTNPEGNEQKTGLSGPRMVVSTFA